MIDSVLNIVLPLVVGALSLLIGCWRQEVARAFDLVDRPDGIRKIHHTSTPVVGGLMFLGCTLILLGLNYFWMLDHSQQNQRFYLFAAIVVPHCILGITDDRYTVPAGARLTYSFSLVIAVLATDRTLVMRDFYFSFGLSFQLGSQLSYLITVLFIVGFIYSVNMIDGLNGILGVYGLLLTGFFSIWLLPGNEVYFLCALVTLSVFLAFNLAGLIFAGDGGSYAIGASAAVLLLHLYDRAVDTRSLPVDMIAVAVFVPIVDAIRVSLARFWRDAGVFSGDRNHLHQLLRDRIGSPWALVAYSSIVVVPILAAAISPARTWVALIIAGIFYGAVVYAPSFGAHRPPQ
jgi:UDP-GlcNAc:undecaprenyl-phosphate GlcNAc-1-phosphate transferase